MLNLKSPTTSQTSPTPLLGKLREEDEYTPTNSITTNSSITSTMGITSSSVKSNEPRTVLREGYAKKVKTMKRRYFVLYKNNATGDILLEHYDNEKKYEATRHKLFKKVKPPIVLNACFAISRRVTNAKNSHAIAIYTASDCFSILFDLSISDNPELEMNEWLDTLVQQKALTSPVRRQSRNEQLSFDQVWQVEILKKGLAAHNPNLLGRHRLCLTSNMLFLYKVEPLTSSTTSPTPNDQPQYPQSLQPFEFLLKAIRKCGHTDNYFNVELGRSSCLGQGDLLMQAEDAALANHMHKAIHEAMRSSTAREASSSTSHNKGRPRSCSTSENSKTTSTRSLASSNSQSQFSSFSGTPAASTFLVAAHQSSTVTSTTSNVRERSYSMHEPTNVSHNGYLDMTPMSTSFPETSEMLTDGPSCSNYIDTSRVVPMNVCDSQVYTMPYFNKSPVYNSEEFPLERVKSYLSPSDEESFDIIKPVRAYSMGSRPQTSSIRPVRANSVGSRPNKLNNIRSREHTACSSLETLERNHTTTTTSATSPGQNSDDYGYVDTNMMSM